MPLQRPKIKPNNVKKPRKTKRYWEDRAKRLGGEFGLARLRDRGKKK